MSTAAPSTALATIQPAFTDAERLALAGFLAGHRGLTREAYALDLRQFTSWCRVRSLNLFAVRRAHIETFARELEARGRARSTVTRRLCTIAGFYKYAVEEELLEHSPAAHVRRLRLDYESHAVTLDRNELGALLVARAAAVDRSFLYRHRDLLSKIHTLEAAPTAAGNATGSAVTRASLQADLMAAQERAIRLNARVHQLEKRLSEALDEQAWRESGLGHAPDLDKLREQTASLEQQIIDLRLKLEEREEELSAARAANRELMTQLNHAARH